MPAQSRYLIATSRLWEIKFSFSLLILQFYPRHLLYVSFLFSCLAVAILFALTSMTAGYCPWGVRHRALYACGICSALFFSPESGGNRLRRKVVACTASPLYCSLAAWLISFTSEVT
jgi:hypothetical protein